MNPIAEDILMHYGVGKMEGAPGRGSGRYPLGSGKNPNQHSGDSVSYTHLTLPTNSLV